MSSVRVPVAVLGVVALLYGALWAPPEPVVHLAGALMAALAIVALLGCGTRARRFAPVAALVSGGVSIAATAVTLGGREPGDAATMAWFFIEAAALTALVYFAVLWGPRAAASAAVVPALATSFLLFRFDTADDLRGRLVGAAVWLAPAVIASGAALYLRWLAAGRRRAVADARREQRLDLANDLHDFVAHDISEIVAQAQAGRLVFGADRPELAKLLERIETAGVRALGSMDRTLALLREATPNAGEAARVPVGGVDDLPALVERFNEGGGPRAVLDSRLTGPVPRETGAVLHRAVTEALTNVRRHAPTAATVSITLTEVDGHVRLRVDDDGRGAPRQAARDSSGLGLAGMAERAESLGGGLSAGPREPAGWRTELRLPLQDDHDQAEEVPQ